MQLDFHRFAPTRPLDTAPGDGVLSSFRQRYSTEGGHSREGVDGGCWCIGWMQVDAYEYEAVADDGVVNGVKLFDVLYVGDDMTHTER